MQKVLGFRDTVVAGSDDLYKRILDSLYDGVYLVDPDRRITYWNLGAERITGYRADEAVGRRCQDDFLVHMDDRGNSLCLNGCPLSWTMANGQPQETEVYLQHKDGYRVPISVRATPIRDGTGRVVGAVEVFSDNSRIAAMTDLNKELRQLSLLDPLTEIGNRRFLENSGFTEGGETIRVTVSVGGVLAAAGENPEAVIRRADRLMLASKTAGRNRVTIGDLPGPE
jgi:PAS domain S-box-containing protein